MSDEAKAIADTALRTIERLEGRLAAAYAEIRRLQEDLAAKNEVLGTIKRGISDLAAEDLAERVFRRYPVNPQPPEADNRTELMNALADPELPTPAASVILNILGEG